MNKPKQVIKTGSFESIPGRVLILGSRATFKSLKRGMFYTSNKNGNIIWEILDNVFAERNRNYVSMQNKYIDLYDSKNDVEIIKNEILNMLNEDGIGLSDVLFECESKSSLDSDIQNGVVNPNLKELCRNAAVIVLNGSTAGKLFKREYQKWNITTPYHVLPSTSNTPGQYVKSKKDKIKEWSEIISKYKQKSSN